MTKVFSEYFGELDSAQLKLYIKKNVSPADHDLLIEKFGDDTASLMDWVKTQSAGGYFTWAVQS